MTGLYGLPVTKRYPLAICRRSLAVPPRARVAILANYRTDREVADKWPQSHAHGTADTYFDTPSRSPSRAAPRPPVVVDSTHPRASTDRDSNGRDTVPDWPMRRGRVMRT